MNKKIKKIKLLVFDIDGTIVADGKPSISPKLKEAIGKAEQNGYKTLIATGRHFKFIHKSLFEDLKPDYLVTINGGSLVDKDGNIIESYTLPIEIVDRLIVECEKKQIAIAFKCKEDIVVYTYYNQYVEGYVGFDSPLAKLLIDNTDKKDYHLTHGLPLGAFIIGNHETIKNMQKDFPELEFAASHRVGYDVFMSNVTKGTTVESLLKKSGLTWENVMSFGDAGNDIDMIQKASIGVAMGNAKDYVKNSADYVTDTVDNDGVVKALEHFKII